RLPGPDPGGGRCLGGAVLHRHGISARLHDQVPPLPQRVPGDRARPLPLGASVPRPPPSSARPTEARAAAARAVRTHDENFPVAFLLLPRELRADMRAGYPFFRETR